MVSVCFCILDTEVVFEQYSNILMWEGEGIQNQLTPSIKLPSLLFAKMMYTMAMLVILNLIFLRGGGGDLSYNMNLISNIYLR